MIATAHQSCYQPWLGLLQKIASADVFISWDSVQREDSGYENRQRILGGQWLTVPIHRSREVKIKDLTIANEHDWQRKHMRAIELAYSSAPHWKRYEPTLRWLYEQARFEKLVDLNEQILTILLREFDVQVKRLKLSDLGVTTHKVQQIIDACKKVGAWKYVFGAHGPDYAKASECHAAGIEPFVQTYEAVPYPQGGGGIFEPNLWAFDLLLHKGPEEGRDIMMAGGTIRRME